MADEHNDYPYAPDRFDREAETTSFHGAHRAEEPFWRQNLLYLAVIAAALLTLLILLFVIGGLGGGDEDPKAAPTTTSAPAAQGPTSDGGGDAAPAGEGDRSTPVLVINAGGQKGVAGAWRTALEDKGWNEVAVETSDSRQEEPVVFYKDEKDAASADMLAKDAGLEGAQQSDEYDARITFVAVNPPEEG